ncbi:hypothetical protein GF420_12300 [candidate division GN15 bacterium]|nr:hypothetical protein [candidate division GN15 bacterium]
MKWIAAALCCVVLLASCGGKKEVADEVRQRVQPVDLRVEPDHEKFTVIWETAGDGLISGYNIYISQTPLVNAEPGGQPAATPEPFNATPFPGDTDPSDDIEHYEAEGVDEGVVYYVSVRVVYPDGTLSPPSNEVEAAAGGRGELELGMRYNSANDGFSFVQDDFVEADAVANDIYYYNAAGSHFLASPVRLNGFLRNTRLMKLPVTGSLNEVTARLETLDPQPSEDRVEIAPGDWLLLQTEDDTHALVEIRGMVGEGQDAILQLWYAYCSSPDRLIF